MLKSLSDGRLHPGLYLLTLPSNRENLLDILPQPVLFQEHYQRIPIVVVGACRGRERAMELTDGAGYDHVFETAGNPVTDLMCFELAGNKSHVTFIGTPHTNLTFTPRQWENANRKEFYLTGSWMSYSAPFPGKEWKLTAHYFATGELRFDPAFIYRTYPMSQAWEAFQLFDAPQNVHGKVMLVNE